MPLESIIDRILDEARKKGKGIVEEARAQADSITGEANKEAESLYQGILNKEKAACEHKRQRLIVNARIEGKKRVLEAKQGAITSVFEKIKPDVNKAALKKENVSQHGISETSEDIDFYLNRIRPDLESGIAEVLFGG